MTATDSRTNGCDHAEGDGCYRCCRACNYDQHSCPGCGANLSHGTAACAACIKAATTVSLDTDPVTAAWYQAILGWDAQIAELQAKRARAVEHIQHAMGNATEATLGGKPVVTWKPSKPGKQLDRKALEAKFGTDVIKSFEVDKNPARPFRILGGSE